MNGAVDTNWYTPPYADGYRSGIFGDKYKKKYQEGKINAEIEKVGKINHATIIIGWGVEAFTGDKYWIVRNSYGADYGMQSIIWIQRGTNEFEIESNVTAYDVELI